MPAREKAINPICSSFMASFNLAVAWLPKIGWPIAEYILSSYLARILLNKWEVYSIRRKSPQR